MLYPPKPATLKLHAQAFKKMQTIKFLIVKDVHIHGFLEYLPNSIVLLDWANCLFPCHPIFVLNSLSALTCHIVTLEYISYSRWYDY